MSSRAQWHRVRPLRRSTIRPILENLEPRLVLSWMVAVKPIIEIHHSPGADSSGSTANPAGILPMDFGSPTPVGYTPEQIDTAYGIDKIMFGANKGDGTGQTIAIVDAYDEPTFVDSTVNGLPNPAFANSDLAQFDLTFGLPDPPSFTKYNQTGGLTIQAGTDPAGAGNLSGTWELEESLDIEWAHAVAPGANIDLVEANGTTNSDLFTAVATAAKLPGVSVVSMSWGLPEASGELTTDSTFTTPSGHQGVTFIAASGDQGSPGYYPAYSSNVLATGGTTLNLNADNSYQSETAWSGSGGGTSQYESEPAYQSAVQSTGKRTIPDVAWDADPNTGVAVYDSWDDTDNSGPWLEIGGTSVASPSWAGLIAIADQGRVNAGGTTLDGPTQTLPALYSVSASDFHDITKGSNGGFSAGPGYDEVTGLGSPKANLLVPDLVGYGIATQMVVTNQPPSSVIAGDSFGIIVSAENAEGGVDTAYNGKFTIALANNPSGATLGGTLTVTASHGQGVFSGLSMNLVGTGYKFLVTDPDFTSVDSAAFNVIANATPGSGTFYPVGTDSSLRAAITAADSNSFASNTIVLSVGTYELTNPSLGQIVIQNKSSLAAKTLTIVGAGETSTVIEPDFYPWRDRLFEVVSTSGASISVAFQGLTLKGGNATSGGILGGTVALGGAILIDGGAVRMTNVAVANNEAQGASGALGKAGASGQAGGSASAGGNARGGGIYLAAGTLTLTSDVISNNIAKGGEGGTGGNAGNQHAGKSAIAKSGGAGGNGGNGGTAAGGGVYVFGGTLLVSEDTFGTNQAVGGNGGVGGMGGDGVLGKSGGAGGNGGQAGAASGGAIYLAQGSVTLDLTTFQANSAVGGAGGTGGAGGPGSSLLVTTSLGLTLSGSILSGGTQFTQLFHGGPGGNGGNGGAGGGGAGGGVYVFGGTLTITNATLSKNEAIGGKGGLGGNGGTAGIGSLGTLLGFSGGGTIPLGGSGGTGGAGGSGAGGGLYLAGGTVTVGGATLSGNLAIGGAGGSGGRGGAGGFAGGLSGSFGTGGGTSPSPGILRSQRQREAQQAARAGQHAGYGGAPMLIGTGTNTFPTIGVATGGPGGPGGDGGQGHGGAIYVIGGKLTLVNDTVADNSVQGGAAGSGGPGGKGGSKSLGNGPAGSAGQAGEAFGGGAYVAGGTVSLFNSTVALNTQTGTGSGGGVVQVAGSVSAVSTLFAGNGAVDYSGTITANNCLFQAAPAAGTITGASAHNLTGTNPLLAAAGLASNGGPTQTIALQTGSPAINAGANPETLFTDQRGDSPRGGAGTTDIGAYQHNGTADTTLPTATLSAPAVTASSTSTSYTFTVTYADNLAIALSSLAGAIVIVTPPSGGVPIAASVQSTKAVGATDALGDAAGFLVTYQITPPGGSWSAPDDGVYMVTLGSTPVTDLTGNAVAKPALGTFSVNVVASSSTANFLKQDSTTQGNWIGKYGSQGYDVIGDTPQFPTGDTVTPAGATYYLQSASTTDKRALQNPGGSGRIAAILHSTTSFTIDLNLGDGQTHNVELYFLDWSNTGRSEQVQIADAGTGAILSTQSVSSFYGGVYLTYSISGNVVITFTKLAGPDAMVGGLFLDPAQPPPQSGTATFIGTNTKTQGSWSGVYGLSGYNIINNAVNYPSDVTVSATGETLLNFTSSTTDPRALQNAPGTGTGRSAAAWRSTSSFTVNIDVTDSTTYDVSLYFVDWSNTGRSEQVQITNAATGAVLSTQNVSSFYSGVYLTWAISGDVVFTFTKLAGPDASVSAFFFDAAPPPPQSGTATFIGTNTKTQGSWSGVFGSKGYNIIGSAVSYPSDVTLTASGETLFNFTSSTTDPRALQNAPGTGTGRSAAIWRSTSSFTVNVDITDSTTYDVSLYFLDWSNTGRSEQVQITNAATRAVLSTQNVSSFYSGVYLTWAISGDVVFTFTKLAGPDASVSAFFFDPAGSIASAVRGATASQMLAAAPTPTAATAVSEPGLAVEQAHSLGNLVTPLSATVTPALGTSFDRATSSASRTRMRHRLIREERRFLARRSLTHVTDEARVPRAVALERQLSIRRHPLVMRNFPFKLGLVRE